MRQSDRRNVGSLEHSGDGLRKPERLRPQGVACYRILRDTSAAIAGRAKKGETSAATDARLALLMILLLVWSILVERCPARVLRKLIIGWGDRLGRVRRKETVLDVASHSDLMVSISHQFN
jgi:hypothetical protein